MTEWYVARCGEHGSAVNGRHTIEGRYRLQTMGESPRIASRFNAVVVVFALAIQFVNGFELLSVFNIVYFPIIEALSSSFVIFINDFILIKFNLLINRSYIILTYLFFVNLFCVIINSI